MVWAVLNSNGMGQPVQNKNPPNFPPPPWTLLRLWHPFLFIINAAGLAYWGMQVSLSPGNCHMKNPGPQDPRDSFPHNLFFIVFLFVSPFLCHHFPSHTHNQPPAATPNGPTGSPTAPAMFSWRPLRGPISTRDLPPVWTAGGGNAASLNGFSNDMFGIIWNHAFSLLLGIVSGI